MKTFFILGRNPELSRVEVLEFLKARGRTHREVLFEENLLIVETDEGEKFDIQEFGGVMWLGEITFEGEDGLEEYLESGEIVPADKFSYAVFGNGDEEIVKDVFKERKKKAMIKHGGKQIEFQGGEKVDLPKADFGIFFHESDDAVYFGLATQEYDNFQVKKRDMEKPVRRESLAISPRLAKILVNLSGATPRSLVLDPFCGIGGILQEALIKGINAHGIDKDKDATIGAEENLKWILSEYKTNARYTVEFKDSVKAPDLQFAGIATETPLGKVFRKKPTDNEAKKVIQDFEALIIPILKRLKSVKKPAANIAITFPAIRKFHVDAEKVAKKTGLKIYINPILESRSDQFISRDIVVFN
jgi:tRNA G10  N-methylase Trm11